MKNGDEAYQVVRKLLALIEEHNWSKDFEEAVERVREMHVDHIAHVTTVKGLLQWLEDTLTKPPRYIPNRQDFYEDGIAFYLFLNQEPLKRLQSPTTPASIDQHLTPLSAWIAEYMKSWGSYLDTFDSAKYIQSFKEDLTAVWNDYMEPPSGYLTFNQFFARHVKPGKRPISSIADSRVIVSPADSTFVGSWQIDEDSNIQVQKVLNLKGLKWSITQLLHDSPYKDAFKGGSFSHSFLNVYDYHRFHSPVEGRILEARVIKGQVNCNVTITEHVEGQRKIKILEAADETGYQFTQMRGLVVIDSPIGLVACLPIGMGLISSIVFTAEERVYLRKGEELGFFQAGGSDCVLVFQKESRVELSWKEGVKRKQGEVIGMAKRNSFEQ